MQNADMAFDVAPPHHLRAWRLFRGLSQDELAARVGTTKAVISNLELSERGLSHKWLARLAPVLGTSAGAILDVDPNDAPPEVMQVWSEIPADRRAHALDVLRTFQDRKAG